MDLYGIDLNLLVAFDALMAERNVTRAGKRTGRTQPAMSAALARLRALFRDDLFIRSPGGLQPTQRAMELAEPIERALGEIRRTLDFVQSFDPATSTQRVSLAVPEHPGSVLLPKLAQALSTHAPGMTMRVVTFTHRDHIVALLDAGDVDVTIGVPARQASGRIMTRTLFEERFVCILRHDHPAASRPLTLNTFLELSHLLISPEGDRYGLVDAALAATGQRRRVAFTLPHAHAAPGIIANSDLIATVLEGIVDTFPAPARLAIRTPPLEIAPVSFVMSWHRRNDAHPMQIWLRSMIAGLTSSGPVP